MNGAEPTVVIKVDATGGEPFKYQGDGEYSRCVSRDGTIDLRKKGKDLKRLYLEFQLEPTEVEIDGVLHSLEFQGGKSISFGEKSAPHTELRTNSPFDEIETPKDGPHKLRVLNKNHEKKDYKYTLRVMARAQGGDTGNEWSHDPIIQNTGGGYLK